MKKTIRYFVSYAHDNGTVPGELLRELGKHLRACADFDFQPWRDTDLLLGEKWHEEILRAIAECDFGLLLVSPSFLGSKYIGEHELPPFLDGQKLCLPVALHPLDLRRHDLKGLKDVQIFHYQPDGAEPARAFSEFSGRAAAGFALALFQQIHARLEKHRAPSDPRPPTTSKRHNLPSLQPFFGREEELAKIAEALDPESRGWGALIDGPGGMGKTSLAVRAAYDASPAVFHKIVFVSLKARGSTTTVCAT